PVVRGRGLDFARLSGDPKEIVDALVDSGANLMAFARRFRENIEPYFERNLEETVRACEDADAVIYATVGLLGYFVAKQLGKPAVEAGLQPVFNPTRYFPSSVSPGGRSLGGLYNRMSYTVARRVFWHTLLRPLIEQSNSSLHPVPLRSFFEDRDRHKLPQLYGWSPSVLKKPPDWPGRTKVTGYWFLEQLPDWTPPGRLVDFLEAGAPPVAVGFSSVRTSSWEEIIEKLLRALRARGLRTVLLTGWNGIRNTDLPDDVFAAEEIPHDWLFPRVKAVVHHGGAGTTAAALRAAAPMITIPFSADQAFWGRRVAELGAGTEPIPRNGRFLPQLTHAIERVVGEAAFRQKAASLANRIRSEDGVSCAAQAFERSLEHAG
ncbi:MAG: glycosyltransferase, partial [Rubrobacteraceae bacterium]